MQKLQATSNCYNSSTVIEIGFDPTFYTVNETDGTVRLRITKTGDNANDVSVTFTTQAGSASGEYQTMSADY